MSIQALFASDNKTFILGGKNGWNAVSDRRNITTTSGRYGYEALEIENTNIVQDYDTDLLLNFESISNSDVTGNYEIVTDLSEITKNAARGKGAGAFSDATKGISLSGQGSSIFGSSGLVGSFTIGFYLRPLTAESGEIVLMWNSSRDIANYSLYQMVVVEVHNNRLLWNFTNFFDFNLDSSEYEFLSNPNNEIILEGSSALIPKKWAYHQVSFDDNTGLFEYTVDGRVEDLCYVTKTGNERGEVCLPHLGVPAMLEIAPSFTGSIDEFCISRSNKNLSKFDEKYHGEGGRFISEPFCLSDSGATVSMMEVLENVPSQTAVEYFIRSGEHCFDWTEDYPEWEAINPDEEVAIQGKFFQVAADLYTDGGGQISPSVTEIKLVYSVQDPPLPPYQVKAVPKNGSVDLTWYSASGYGNNKKVGYYIYYGEKSGEYLGTEALQGSSPIMVTDFGSEAENSFTIDGLENGRIYYFAISSFPLDNPDLEGELSSEVFARPSSRL